MNAGSQQREEKRKTTQLAKKSNELDTTIILTLYGQNLFS